MADSVTFLLLGISIALNAVCIRLMTRPQIAVSQPLRAAIDLFAEQTKASRANLDCIIAAKRIDNETQ